MHILDAFFLSLAELCSTENEIWMQPDVEHPFIYSIKDSENNRATLPKIIIMRIVIADIKKFFP